MNNKLHSFKDMFNTYLVNNSLLISNLLSSTNWETSFHELISDMFECIYSVMEKRIQSEHQIIWEQFLNTLTPTNQERNVDSSPFQIITNLRNGAKQVSFKTSKIIEIYTKINSKAQTKILLQSKKYLTFPKDYQTILEQTSINEINQLIDFQVHLINSKISINTITNWVNKKECSIIYDSDFQEFTPKAFRETISGRQDILTIIFTMEDDIFGSYHHKTTVNWNLDVEDPDFFIFSLNNYGRGEPTKFTKCNNVNMPHKSFEKFSFDKLYSIHGGFSISTTLHGKTNMIWPTMSTQYQPLNQEKLLCGKTGRNAFVTTRLLIIQLDYN
ncbi:TLDc domain-containing protein [Entamoeba marina]